MIMKTKAVDPEIHTSENDPINLKGIHHLEFWVGNAKQTSFFYRKAFGFSQIAYSGLETGNREFASYALQQGEINLVFSTPYNSENEISQHIEKHGDGVKDISFHVDDVDRCFNAAVERGAIPVSQAQNISDDNGSIRKASIQTYGDTIHSFISDDKYNGPFLPTYRKEHLPEKSTGIYFIDHVVGNVEKGKMEEWVSFYKNIMGFNQLLHFTDDDISTEYTALMSKVMQNGSGRIKFPINEPADGKKKSQIEEYLDFYNGPGVQHIALKTDDIIKTISHLKDNGIEFLIVPHTYYQDLGKRVGKIDENMDIIQKLGILVDSDDEGYLLQLFTKPVEDRPTLFFEIIQRKGCQGFGVGNFKALFEAIERIQNERGTL
jgi:4-hydroxyphenylpyruvate dioxygenase